MKKNNFSISQFVIKSKTIVRNLASVGEPVNEKDLILYLVRCLGSQYQSFKTNILMRDNIPSVETFHTLLEDFEHSLHKNDVDQSQLFHANMARFGTKNGCSRYKSQAKGNNT